MIFATQVTIGSFLMSFSGEIQMRAINRYKDFFKHATNERGDINFGINNGNLVNDHFCAFFKLLDSHFIRQTLKRKIEIDKHYFYTFIHFF